MDYHFNRKSLLCRCSLHFYWTSPYGLSLYPEISSVLMQSTFLLDQPIWSITLQRNFFCVDIGYSFNWTNPYGLSFYSGISSVQMQSTFLLDQPIWTIILLGNFFCVDIVYICIGPAHMDYHFTRKSLLCRCRLHFYWTSPYGLSLYPGISSVLMQSTFLLDQPYELSLYSEISSVQMQSTFLLNQPI